MTARPGEWPSPEPDETAELVQLRTDVIRAIPHNHTQGPVSHYVAKRLFLDGYRKPGTPVLVEVLDERRRQDPWWGEQNHPNGTGGLVLQERGERTQRRTRRAFDEGRGTWRHILQEEVDEALAEFDPARLRAELVQVAAVAVAWIEAIDRGKQS